MTINASHGPGSAVLEVFCFVRRVVNITYDLPMAEVVAVSSCASSQMQWAQPFVRFGYVYVLEPIDVPANLTDGLTAYQVLPPAINTER